MTPLHRITVDYVESEDRLRLRGQSSRGEIVVLWLTQRLLSRVVPHLCSWLEKQTAVGAPVDIVQGFAQQAAQDALEPCAPVMLPATDAGALIHSIDLTPGSKAFTLAFKLDSAGTTAASLVLEARALRQWLGILYRTYQAAGWSAQPWPAWVVEAKALAGNGQTTVLH